MAKLVFWRRQPVTEVTRSTTRQVTKRRDNTSYLPLFRHMSPHLRQHSQFVAILSRGTETAESGRNLSPPVAIGL